MLSPLRARAPLSVERAALFTTIGLLTAAAWLALGFGEGIGFSLAHAAHHGSGIAFFPLFLASWTLMTVAMMLPASLPVMATLHAFASRRGDRWILLALAITGYLSVWTAFGVLAYSANLLWHRASSTAFLQQVLPDAAPVLLLVAGAFQFSSLKYKCLDKCRSPFSFVVGHWQGRRQHWQALLMGLHHGIYCVGCCWALMMLMFAVSYANLTWMVILAVIMALEKNAPWGKRLRTPLGVVLLACGALLLMYK